MKNVDKKVPLPIGYLEQKGGFLNWNTSDTPDTRMIIDLEALAGTVFVGIIYFGKLDRFSSASGLV